MKKESEQFSKALWLALLVLLLSIAVIMTSCSTTTKLKTTEVKTVDSARSTISNEVAVKSNEVLEIKAKDTSNTTIEELTVNFSDDQDTAGLVRANDYEGAPLIKGKDEVFKYTIDGREILTPRLIKSATIKNQVTGKVSTVEVKQVKNNDSLSRQVAETTTTHIESKTRNKEKVTKGATIVIWLPVILCLLGGGFCIWYFGLYKRRKPDKDQLA